MTYHRIALNFGPTKKGNLMKKFLPIFFAVAISASAQTYLKVDFEEGIPASFACHDLDKNEPAIDMAARGFEVGKAWIVSRHDKDGGLAACATSWYSPAGSADDWMITPEFTVDSADAVLSWKATSLDPEFREGYKVYISDVSSDPEKFRKEEPVFAIAAEQKGWTQRQLSLAPWVGKRIRVAFADTSNDRSAIFIDDIFAGIPSALTLDFTPPRVVNQEGVLILTGTVGNRGNDTLRDIRLAFTAEGDSEKLIHVSHILAPGETLEFEINTGYNLSHNATVNYNLRAISEEVETDPVRGKTSSYSRRIVTEEVTGTWCGYCVKGIVAMRQMKKKYPDTFLGIAVHQGSPTWPDPMDYSAYSDFLFDQYGFQGYPNSITCRSQRFIGDPLNIETHYITRMAEANLSGLDVSVDYNKSTGVVEATAECRFANDIEDADYRIAFVVIEQQVHKDDEYDADGNLLRNEYVQNNAYAGSSVVMGGFESMPSRVPGGEMWYDDVARLFVGDGFGGFAHSLPTSFVEDIPVTFTRSFQLPMTILDENNVEICALLINNKNGEIINGAQTDLIKSGNKVNAVSSSGNNILIRFDGQRIHADTSSEVESITLIDSTGAIVGMTHNASSIEATGYHGFHLVLVQTSTGRTVRKIML